MKYGIPLGALLLIGLGVWLHQMPDSAPAFGPRGKMVPKREIERETVGRPEKRPLQSELLRSDEAVSGRLPESPVASNPAPGVPDWRKVFATLDRTLALAPIQVPEVERILRQRQEDIRACHEAIRKAGVLDIRAYEWQVRRMKEEWYRSIDFLLDRSQHDRFVALVEGGFFNEGLAFSVEPGMMVLE